MSINYTALLGLSAGIQVAKADYDFARDGGALAERPLASAIVPSGSVILGAAIYTSAAMVFNTTGNILVKLGAAFVAGPHATLGYIRTVFWYDTPAIVTDADRALTAYISNDVCTAGAFDVWVFYLPT